MCLLNHNFIPFSGKPQKSEVGMQEREILLLFTFSNMSTAELFDKIIFSEKLGMTKSQQITYKVKTLLEFRFATCGNKV